MRELSLAVAVDLELRLALEEAGGVKLAEDVCTTRKAVCKGGFRRGLGSSLQKRSSGGVRSNEAFGRSL